MIRLIRPLVAGLFLTAATIPAITTELRASTPDDTLVYALSLAQVISLDPHQNADVTSVEIMANLYDGLLQAESDGTLTPQLAQSWEVTPDSITFHLNPDAKFNTGRKVTAEDVAWSIARMIKLDMAVAAAYRPLGYTKDTIDGMLEVVDDETLRLKLTGAMAGELLLYRIAGTPGGVVDREVAMQHEKAGDMGNDWLRVNSAGAGPFVLSRWTPNDMVILEANPNYWQGAPKLKRVIMRHVPESQVQRLMLERGDVDIAAALSATDVAYFVGKPGIEIQSVPSGGFYYLSINMMHPILQNDKVREAIFRAVDWDAIEKTIMGPYGKRRHIPAPLTYDGAIPDPVEWNYNPEEAKALLAEAGYPDGFSVSIKTIAQTPRIDLATAIQAALSEVGIEAAVIQGSGADMVSMHRARDFDLLIPQTGSFMPNILGSMEAYTFNPNPTIEDDDGGRHIWRTMWQIPELTAMTAAALEEPDGEKRKQILIDIQELFAKSSPAAFPMYERFVPLAISDRVDGYVGHPTNSVRLEHVTKSK